MTSAEPAPGGLHEDADLFRAAVNYTAAVTAFTPRLIEKDYFCSVALAYVAPVDSLVFRGGTCLAKIHAGFYRLSEDLDFVISMPIDSGHGIRQTAARVVRDALVQLPDEIPAFRMVDPWTGANNSTQYVIVLGYTSLLNRQPETIKIEVSLREPLLMPVLSAQAMTLLLDPVSGDQLLKPIPVRCLAKLEAYAEKYRAALTRLEVAIRDFYDVDHAFRRLGVLPDDHRLVGLVRQKLAVSGTGPVDISADRLAALRQQLETQLRPVLRDQDFADFKLESALEVAARMAAQATPGQT